MTAVVYTLPGCEAFVGADDACTCGLLPAVAVAPAGASAPEVFLCQRHGDELGPSPLARRVTRAELAERAAATARRAPDDEAGGASTEGGQ